ncbi:DEAD/DEAH box helicase [Bdellovibrionota bacterium FG-2]
MSAFSDFNLLSSLQTTLTEKELVTPTEIQDRAMPLLLAGRSVVGVAETGSGKTLAYALPLLHLLKKLETQAKPVSIERQPRAVVVVPTRELGEQVSRVFKSFTHATRLRVRTVLGGTTLEIAKRNIQGHFEILVATPGRLVKLIDRRLLNLSDVRTLIFDEADQMLDQGFLPDALRIVSACPPKPQLVLFSATVSPAVQALMNKLFVGVEVIRSQGSHHLVPTLTTKNLNVIDGKRFPLLESLLVDSVKGGTLIFTNTRAQCDKLALELKKIDRPCAVYRGEMDKVERRANLKTFRDGKIDLLISTDLASRGLDVEHVGRVINYHLPQQMENYIHRVGRTARAGRKGLVINFVTERDEPLVRQLKSVQAAPRGPRS